MLTLLLIILLISIPKRVISLGVRTIMGLSEFVILLVVFAIAITMVIAFGIISLLAPVIIAGIIITAIAGLIRAT